MKIKKKGKVFPSPSSSSSSSSSSSFNGEGDVLSVLKLLPAAIFALTSVLSLEDREVLSYMITRSINTTNPSPSSVPKKSSKKSNNGRNNSGGGGGVKGHKPPIFECDCFDCYTSYWYRWDSSSNRELIHQVIEAFEDSLSNGEHFRKNTRSSKRRDKAAARRNVEKQPESPVPETHEPPSSPPAENALFSITPSTTVEVEESPSVVVEVEKDEEEAVVVRTAASSHKGFARKVLPDVIGLVNSRLWGLWNPNA